MAAALAPLLLAGCLISGQTAEEIRLADLVNQLRGRKGLVALEHEPELLAVARRHSRAMAARQFFAHEDPEGRRPWDRVREARIMYVAVAENLGYYLGPADPVMKVFEGWKKSPDHYVNMVADKYTHGAVGAASDEKGGIYFTHLFLRKRW